MIGFDGVGAKRHIARRLGRFQADPGLEPLALVVDDADRYGRDLAIAREELNEVVVSGFGGGSQECNSPAAFHSGGMSWSVRCKSYLLVYDNILFVDRYRIMN